MALDYLDSPGVAAGTTLTYAALHGHWQGAGSTYINYALTYTNFSTMILMEIAP
jgi:Na+/alanine symporter